MVEIYNLLAKYSLRTKKHVLEFIPFTHFVLRNIPEQQAQGSVQDQGLFSPLIVSSELEALAENKKCELAYEAGKISTIIFPAYFMFAAKAMYNEIEKNHEVPFPSDTEFGGSIPHEMIKAVNMKEEFLHPGNRKQAESFLLTRIHFPEGINSLIVPTSYLGSKLMELAVQKIKGYLNIRRNSDYMQSKMRVVFKQRERAVKDMFTSVMSQTRNAITTLSNPNDFSFQFWNHLSTSIIQEFKEKNNKMEKEHSFSQAAHLVSHYNLYFKGRIQQKKEQETAFRSVKNKLRKAPYFFTLSDIYAFKNDKGLKLSKKYDKDLLHKYLESKIKPKDDNTIPEILRLKTEDKKEYFICSDTFLPLCLKKVGDSRKYFKDYFLNDWKRKLNSYHSTRIMNYDDYFEKEVAHLLKMEDSLLYTMMRFDLLFLTLTETKPPLDVSSEIERYLDRSGKKLQPLIDVLLLDRREILKQAKNSVSIWKINPVLRMIAKLFLGVGKGSKEEKAKAKKAHKRSRKTLGVDSSPVDKTEQSVSGTPAGGANSSIRYANAIRKLKVSYIGEGGNLNSSLKDLQEKWNPLYDVQAKKNLVEDVNSMIRDYLRKLKRGFMIKPPDKARVENIADQLAMNSAFHKIKRKDYFRKYIALYMLNVLGQVK